VHKPLLDDLIQVCERYTRERGLPAVRYNIEIKSSPTGDRKDHPLPDEFADLVLAVVQKRNITDRSTIQSFDIRPLQYLNQLNAPVKLSFLTESEDDLSVITKKLGFIPDVYSPAYKLVDKKLVDDSHQLQMLLIPWTVNEKADMEKLIKMGVDGLITDYPDRAQEVLRKSPEN
jgi:glycerophosphoryl diester phosphodiesterase